MKLAKDRSTAFAWLGITGVAVFIIIWMCAMSADPAWKFGVNTLSEFGVSDTDARLYFNYGCMITGALAALFGIGRALYGKNAGHTAGGILIAIGGAFLALVGVFTMDDLGPHAFVAISMAGFLFLGVIAMAAGNWMCGRKVFAGIGVVFAFLLAAMAVAYDVAMLEAYGIILLMAWFLLESVNMIMSSEKG